MARSQQRIRRGGYGGSSVAEWSRVQVLRTTGTARVIRRQAAVRLAHCGLVQLRRVSPTSAPGLAHSCAGTARAETETEPAKLGDDALMQRAVSESEEGYENQKKGLTIATGVPRTAVSKERSRR